MTDDNDGKAEGGALVSVTIKDLFGLKNAYPALTKTVDRMVSAVERGTGVMMRGPSIAIEAKAKRYAAKQEAATKIELMQMYVNAAEDFGIVNPSAQVEHMFHRMIKEDIEKQLKRESIAAKAIEHLSQQAPLSSDASSSEDIDLDWLDLFWACAERKRNNELQDIFARILAREALQPGHIDPAALHLLSILTPRQAKMIQRILSVGIFSENDDDYFIVEAPLSEHMHLNDAPDWFDFGLTSEDFLTAEHLGILVRSITVMFDEDDSELDITIGNRRGKLIMRKLDEGKELALKPLSHVAKSLRHVVPLLDNTDYVDDLTRFFGEWGFSLEMQADKEAKL